MRWLVALLMAVALVGCSAVENQNAEPVPQRSASDLATVRAQAGIVEPTKTPRPAAPTATPRPTVTPMVPRAQDEGFATDSQLQAALLKPSDISSTWAHGLDTGIGIASFCGAPAIEDMFEATGWAHASYSSTQNEWVEQWIIRLDDATAGEAMAYSREAFTCESETFAMESGSSLLWSYQPLELPQAGDDVHALHVEMTSDNPAYTPMQGNVVFVQDGEFVVVLLHYGFKVDSTLTSHIASAAVTRITLAHQQSI